MKGLLRSAAEKVYSWAGGSVKSVASIYDVLKVGYSGLVKGKYNLSAYQGLVYYCSVAPVAKSISILSREMASVSPYVYDFIESEFVKDQTPVESLLNKPNAMQTRNQFMREMATYYLACGKCYVMAIGLIDREPVELQVLQPEFMTIQQNTRDGYPEYYSYTCASVSLTFKRIEQDGRFRFVDESGGRELFHFKEFDPNGTRLEGMSRLDQCYYEIEQHLNSSIHNLSMLKKGARPSGVFTSEAELGKEQRLSLREQLNTNHAGSDNAGRIMLLDGAKFDFKEMSTNMKDMDFLKLKKDVANGIYNAFDIPLPLVNTDSMTYSNYAEAKLTLYDNAVLPLTKELYEYMARALFSRFKMDTDKYLLFYDETEIPALAPRRDDAIKKKKETGVLTINELRALQGYDPIDGGEVLYQPAVLLPVGSVPMAQPAPTKEPEKVSREKFTDIMREHKDMSGQRLYSDTEIEEIADEKGLK